MSSALSTVNKFFPEVTSIKDARRPITIEVTKGDEAKSRKYNHKECAMAIACKRQLKVDGVVISRSVAYIIKNKKAIRFKVPVTVAREVTSFDRGAGFEPGTYQLSKPHHFLGHPGGRDKNGTGTGKPRRLYHMTANIRTALGPREA